MNDKELLTELAKLFYVDAYGCIQWGFIDGIPIRATGSASAKSKREQAEKAFIKYFDTYSQENWEEPK